MVLICDDITMLQGQNGAGAQGAAGPVPNPVPKPVPNPVPKRVP